MALKLLDRQEMYGYELVKAIQTETNGRLHFGEGCIYPVLHYREQSNLVSSRRKEVDGRSRVYYRVTETGKTRMEEMSQDWREVMKGVTLIMGGQNA